MKPNKRITAFVMLAAAMLVFASCTPLTTQTDRAPHSAAVTPSLTVTGDVENELILRDFADYTVSQIAYNEETVPSIMLQSVLADVIPLGADISLFFSSPDGVMAQVPLSEIDENAMLLLTSEHGWVFYSESHPKQSRIRQMDKIVVSAKEPATMQKCFRMMYGERCLTRTYGQLFNEDALVFSVLEGEAAMSDTTTSAYTRRQLIPLAAYAQELGASAQSSALAYFANGSQREIDLNGYLEWRGDSADYIGADKKAREPDIIGVWLDAPVASITDIASTVLGKAKQRSVLIIELDGVGYYNLLELKPEFLSSKNMTAMRTVMPSISNVALAAIVTGELPPVNGIAVRKQRDLLVDDMFATASDAGLKCVVIEGSTSLITLSVDQMLNPDTNNDGDTDNEVQDSALAKIRDGYQFLYVHYHGFDDVAHTYGPSTDEAAHKLDVLDGYVKALCEDFSGTVIITADHGQHTTDSDTKPGDHGEFIPADMTVPFIMFEVNES